ncbi:MAG: hypothetical protein HMLKMBBP_02902 [Planctomycetes bacterium]|nr:hypothetical protein [Planctomycetota bacterium]
MRLDSSAGKLLAGFRGDTLPEASAWILDDGRIPVASRLVETRLSDRNIGARLATLTYPVGSVVAVAIEPGGSWVRTMRPDGAVRGRPPDIPAAAASAVRGKIPVNDRRRLSIGTQRYLLTESRLDALHSGSGILLARLVDARIAERDFAGALAAATKCTEQRPRYGFGWLKRLHARTAFAASREPTAEGSVQRAKDRDLAVADRREAVKH